MMHFLKLSLLHDTSSLESFKDGTGKKIWLTSGPDQTTIYWHISTQDIKLLFYLVS